MGCVKCFGYTVTRVQIQLASIVLWWQLHEGGWTVLLLAATRTTTWRVNISVSQLFQVLNENGKFSLKFLPAS
jgi:hypothetical protein